jgi:hypothetical protein
MKSLRHFMVIVLVSFLLSSCNLWNKVFPPKYGCPSNGKNIGAERLLGQDKKAEKAAKKAKKFRP